MFYTKKLSFLHAIFLAVFVLLLFPFDAHAGYLDPGSGSSFVQGIISILAFFGRIVDRIKQMFGFRNTP